MFFCWRSWEKVMETDNTLGVFRQGKESEEKLLVVSYKTHEDQVIRLELSGNAGKVEMLRLAQRYTEAGKLAEPWSRACCVLYGFAEAVYSVIVAC
ncbi:hypothetical protein PM3016_6199 [Paenibacillus mucilaginosus 3016]|uniref:Uncharacterized protein n=2 Tax=Paenibacillus mucilaginosus TaxID=61624 RepID=H6NRV4_9BACL|nr:hypothetical protein PM3016_6199 [Paenibacillus mucilaginosus 3016]